jgi:hypothetical protein
MTKTIQRTETSSGSARGFRTRQSNGAMAGMLSLCEASMTGCLSARLPVPVSYSEKITCSRVWVPRVTAPPPPPPPSHRHYVDGDIDAYAISPPPSPQCRALPPSRAASPSRRHDSAAAEHALLLHYPRLPEYRARRRIPLSLHKRSPPQAETLAGWLSQIPLLQ